MAEGNLLTCYNKGCGQKFDPAISKDDSCTFHPGVPIFHDAYKSWSCCKKKSTDFTEFLNFKGCMVSSHNPEKPTEEKPEVDKATANDIVEYRAPIQQAMDRPVFESPLTIIEPQVCIQFFQLNRIDLLKIVLMVMLVISRWPPV
jgi:cysteine and histidine-rich domain-containing protein